jgi:ectoine hydrolase
VTAVEPKLSFSQDEYRARLQAVWAAMQRSGFELLIVTDPANMGWWRA